ncbi:hypothetical protein BJY52DRAFT_1225258 [Lactarius psammicola]|nr:hypothetical protein BJY52DRAFT_1225258 [Lactarius psammicola]
MHDDWGFWRPVVTMVYVFHTVIPDGPASVSKGSDDPASAFKAVPHHFQEEALEKFIAVEKGRSGSYALYCSIVQSSGMGKSRLDDFSKVQFLIPVNLRRAEARGFPPPDNVVRELLTKSDGRSGEIRAYSRLLHFLVAIFEKTAGAITKDLKEANSRSEHITNLREFMTNGQTMASVGEKRWKFYREIVDDIEGSKVTVLGKDDVARALNTLLSVLIASDEAQSLTESLESHINQTPFVELCRALQTRRDTSSFSFFVSTTSKVSQLAMLADIAPSLRMNEQEFRPSLPFSDLRFDHLMHNRKILINSKLLRTLPPQIASCGVQSTARHTTPEVRRQIMIWHIERNSPNLYLHARLHSDSRGSRCSMGTGELLVAAFFMQARDPSAWQISPLKPLPYHERPICPIFLPRLVLTVNSALDVVYPSLYETHDLVVKKVGFIIVQVKNRADYMAADANLFKMDLFLCGLLSKEDRRFHHSIYSDCVCRWRRGATFRAPDTRATGRGWSDFRQERTTPVHVIRFLVLRKSAQAYCNQLTKTMRKMGDTVRQNKHMERRVFDIKGYIRGIDSAHHDAWVPEFHIPKDPPD